MAAGPAGRPPRAAETRSVYTPLGAANLKTGQRLDMGVVTAPDADWRGQVAPFLGHKQDPYRAHIARALDGPLDRLETRFYVGTVDGRLVSQVMLVGSRGVGIIGHVHTLAEERRKGACAALFRALLPHAESAGYRVLCLGTGYDTPPYHIYRSFDFRGIAPGSGCMVREAAPGAQAALLAPGPASVRPLRWDDWAWLELLAFQPVTADEELPRGAVMGIRGQESAEGPFVAFQSRRRKEPEIQAVALETGAGATVGWAAVAPDPRWFGDVYALDFHVAPSFQGSLADLLDALALPEAPVVAYLTEPEGPRARLLAARGFQPAARLDDWLRVEDERRPLRVWRRG